MSVRNKDILLGGDIPKREKLRIQKDMLKGDFVKPSEYLSNYGEREKSYSNRASKRELDAIDEETLDRLDTFKKAANIDLGKADNEPEPKYLKNVENFFGKDGKKDPYNWNKDYRYVTNYLGNAYNNPFNPLEAKIRVFINKDEAKKFLNTLDLNPWGDDSKLTDVLLDRAKDNFFQYELIISEFTGKRKYPRGYTPETTYTGKKPTKDYQDLTNKQFEATQQYQIKHKLGFDGSRDMLGFILDKYYGISDFYKINNMYSKILKDKSITAQGNQENINFRRIFKLDLMQKRVPNGSPFFAVTEDDIRDDARIFGINKVGFFRNVGNSLLLEDGEYLWFLPIWLPNKYFNEILEIIDGVTKDKKQLYSEWWKLNDELDRTKTESRGEKEKRLQDLRQEFKMGKVGDAVYSADYPVFYETLGGVGWAMPMSKASDLEHRMERGVIYNRQQAHDPSPNKKQRDNNQFRTDMDKDYARQLVSKEDAAKWLIMKGAKYTNNRNYQIQGEDDKGKNIFGKKWLEDLKEQRRDAKDDIVEKKYNENSKTIYEDEDKLIAKNKKIQDTMDETWRKRVALSGYNDMIKIWNKLGLRYEKIDVSEEIIPSGYTVLKESKRIIVTTKKEKKIKEKEEEYQETEEERQDGTFIKAKKFEGSKDGFVYRLGARGLGYYKDSNQKERPKKGTLALGNLIYENIQKEKKALKDEVVRKSKGEIKDDDFEEGWIRSSEGGVNKSYIIVTKGKNKGEVYDPDIKEPFAIGKLVDGELMKY